MLYLETPVGVGFSYANESSSYEGVNDKITGNLLNRIISISFPVITQTLELKSSLFS